MRGRYWLVLLYLTIGFGFSLGKNDWAWMGRAVPIALGLTTLIVLSGYSREFMVRLRWKQMSRLADEIGARNGELISEGRQRHGVLGYEPELYIRTLRPGNVANVRDEFHAKAARAGYHEFDAWILRSITDNFQIRIEFTRQEGGDSASPDNASVPTSPGSDSDEHVRVYIAISEDRRLPHLTIFSRQHHPRS